MTITRRLIVYKDHVRAERSRLRMDLDYRVPLAALPEKNAVTRCVLNSTPRTTAGARRQLSGRHLTREIEL